MQLVIVHPAAARTKSGLECEQEDEGLGGSEEEDEGGRGLSN